MATRIHVYYSWWYLFHHSPCPHADRVTPVTRPGPLPLPPLHEHAALSAPPRTRPAGRGPS
eukprot:7259925-Heterocapsa_arctica.AAC.1